LVVRDNSWSEDEAICLLRDGLRPIAIIPEVFQIGTATPSLREVLEALGPPKAAPTTNNAETPFILERDGSIFHARCIASEDAKCHWELQAVKILSSAMTPQLVETVAAIQHAGLRYGAVYLESVDQKSGTSEYITLRVEEGTVVTATWSDQSGTTGFVPSWMARK